MVKNSEHYKWIKVSEETYKQIQLLSDSYDTPSYIVGWCVDVACNIPTQLLIVLKGDLNLIQEVIDFIDGER